MTSARAGPRPEPPDDLAHRPLPLWTVPAATPLFRVHPADKDVLHFGRSSDPARRARFDDPRAEYGVTYVAEHRNGAFVEALLRRPGRTLIARSDLEARRLSTISAADDLRLVDLTGAGASAIGATAEVSATHDYTLSWAWSCALFEHPAGVDGIRFRCRHDPALISCALFGREQTWQREPGRRLSTDLAWLAELAARYRFGILP